MPKPAIVIADDDELVREIVATRLSEAGYHVTEAANGAAALAVVAKMRPALLILDWGMPDMDGLTVLRKVLSKPESAQMPVMMLTARGRPQDVREALDFGAAGYMVKPFEPDELLARVERFVKGAGAASPT